jgi:hypothetical protein
VSGSSRHRLFNCDDFVRARSLRNIETSSFHLRRPLPSSESPLTRTSSVLLPMAHTPSRAPSVPLPKTIAVAPWTRLHQSLHKSATLRMRPCITTPSDRTRTCITTPSDRTRTCITTPSDPGSNSVPSRRAAPQLFQGTADRSSSQDDSARLRRLCRMLLYLSIP